MVWEAFNKSLIYLLIMEMVVTNQENIESVMAKGSSIGVICGSRATNGVITTKSGKKGKGLGVLISSSSVYDK
jgi:hypothetical protein